MHTPPGAGGADGAAATDAGLAAVRSPDGWLLASGPNERFAIAELRRRGLTPAPEGGELSRRPR